MREIEGIEEVIRRLAPYWDRILADFEAENARFKLLMSQDHDVLGRVLKCHLIVEHYLDRFLSQKYGIDNLDKARLTFFQKATLLPDTASAASFVKPGIIKLNAIRNRFGHNLQAVFAPDDLGAINQVLELARPNAQFRDAVDRIEAFATVACTWLIIPPPDIEQAFVDAFSAARARQP